jgi:excisionase family DNA binding protein
MSNQDLMTEAEMGEKYYTITELTDVLDVSRPTIYSWLQQGRFPNHFTVGTDDRVIIPAADVEAVRREEAEKLVGKLNRLGFRWKAIAA